MFQSFKPFQGSGRGASLGQAVTRGPGVWDAMLWATWFPSPMGRPAGSGLPPANYCPPGTFTLDGKCFPYNQQVTAF